MLFGGLKKLKFGNNERRFGIRWEKSYNESIIQN